MRPILRALRVVTRSPEQAEYERAHARLMTFRTAATHLEEMYQQGFISSPAWERLRPQLLEQGDILARPVRDLLVAEIDAEIDTQTEAPARPKPDGEKPAPSS